MADFWAKSNGISLSKHTGDVLAATGVLQKKLGNKVPGDWWLGLKYAALLHDSGKVDPAFQERIKKQGQKAEDVPADVPKYKDIPHSILSLFFVRPENFTFSQPYLAHVVISAIVFHHWRESFPDYFLGSQEYLIRKKAGELEERAALWNRLSRDLVAELTILAEKYDLDPAVMGLNTNLTEYLRYNTLGSAGLLIPPYTLVYLPDQIRAKAARGDEKDRARVFIAGNLMRTDHFASMVEESNTGLQIDAIESGRVFTTGEIERALKEKFNTPDYWQKQFFQNHPEAKGGNLVLVAPTGFGKTEFALLWGAGKKNFILLPMRAAVNKIWERTRDMVESLGEKGDDQVALLHSDAALETFSRYQQQGDLESESNTRKAMELARHLARTYIIATADQIAPAALRYPGYERIFAALMNGAMVIDEVQAYDPRAAAIITHLVQQNAYFGGRNLIMTATLPPFISRELVKRLGLAGHQVIRLIDEPEFEGVAASCRHRLGFNVHAGDYASAVTAIIGEAQQGKKVLVVMNTVRAACEIYDKIMAVLQQKKLAIETVLLHSRFILKQKDELEKAVVEKYMPNRPDRDAGPCIVVATQIVEASLDIDADVLFTEPSPADSLIQRMGRVFRRFARLTGNNAPPEANVIIIINGGDQPLNRRRRSDQEEKTAGDVQLASGLKTVYNRDLTALSLVILLMALKGEAGLSPGSSLAEELKRKPWVDCFKKSKGKGNSGNTNRRLVEVIKSITGQTLLLTEKEKMDWVELTYGTLDELRRIDNYPLQLQDYIQKYEETLAILDHGYCSDRKRDAERLFRDINAITGVPIEKAGEFYDSIRTWLSGKNAGSLNFLELALTILPRFTVNCPYLATSNGERVRDLDFEAMLPPGLDIKSITKIRSRLERWLKGIYILDLPYDQVKGLEVQNEQ
ncbi:CRISPR-associated endonuclease/helicase Cas3 [Moorella thermoacetica]|uniref:CRISPR-associated endonuclease/helicase Cas3 n=1 Tax=Neomoorella thermoacetica TaxID=1525 RepID=A0A1J5JJ37_NEOTH|nr:CRISPR-associated helicase/endonuclease Cas3 [Moorella thermoacetica]OIQ09554.1 CRISPR-associated endonuclease/helicase Cas3 [Moorella thermoacetica]